MKFESLSMRALTSAATRFPLAVGAFVALAGASSPVASQVPVVDLSPTRALESMSFTRIRGVLELPDGRLLVADQTEKAIYRVDFERGSRDRIGGVGAGPNEFASPTGIHPFGPGRALVVDPSNARLAVLDAEQRMTNTLPLIDRERSIPKAADDRGGMYFDDVTSLRIRKAEERGAGDRAWVLRSLEGAQRLDTIAPLRIPGPPNAGPFPDWDRWTADAAGRVFVVRNQADYRVDWYHPDGRHIAGPTIDEPRHRIDDADRRAWIEANPRGMSGVTMSRDGEPPPERRRPDVEYPEFLPYAKYGDVWIDAAGRGWVGRNLPASENRATYDVFDAAGRRVAKVRLPVGRELIGFGGRGLYAARRDELDLLWLERYDLASVPRQ